jgi:hypothetical protein
MFSLDQFVANPASTREPRNKAPDFILSFV